MMGIAEDSLGRIAGLARRHRVGATKADPLATAVLDTMGHHSARLDS